MSFLNPYRAYARDITDAPWIFHQYVGLATLGAAMGNRWKMPWYGHQWLFGNLWLILIASSTEFHKSTATRIPQRLMISASNGAIDFPWDGSREGLMKRLHRGPEGVTYIDEFSAFLGLLSRGHMEGMRGFWTSLYDGHIAARAYKNIEDGPPQTTKFDVAISLISSTTTDLFGQYVRESDVGGGFWPRFVLVPAYIQETRKRLPDYDDRTSNAEREQLIGTLKRVMRSQGTMSLSAAARTIYEEWDQRYDHVSIDGTRAAAWKGRFRTTCMKFAMILQCDSEVGPVIQAKPMMDACQMIDDLSVELGRLLTEELPFSWIESQLKKVREILRNPVLVDHDGWIDRSAFMRLIKLESRQMDNVCKTAIEMGIVEEVHRRIAKKGPPSRLYRLVRRQPGEDDR